MEPSYATAVWRTSGAPCRRGLSRALGCAWGRSGGGRGQARCQARSVPWAQRLKAGRGSKHFGIRKCKRMHVLAARLHGVRVVNQHPPAGGAHRHQAAPVVERKAQPPDLRAVLQVQLLGRMERGGGASCQARGWFAAGTRGLHPGQRCTRGGSQSGPCGPSPAACRLAPHQPPPTWMNSMSPSWECWRVEWSGRHTMTRSSTDLLSTRPPSQRTQST